MMCAAPTDRFTDETDRILIVEEDTESRRVLSAMFEARGCRVAVAATLAEVRSSLEPPPALLIFGPALPDGDGEDVIRTVRESGVETCVALSCRDEARSQTSGALRYRPDMLLPGTAEMGRLLARSEGFFPFG